MILDLSQVLANSGATVEIDGCIEFGDIALNGQNIHFTEPVSVKGSVKNISCMLYLDIKCKAYLYYRYQKLCTISFFSGVLF